ncbi:PREDICTED: uncharacterized protein LOC106116061 [Papilio xuthus]|uniref:Uncharacterized protein LOC106116061 n=1 Tax=Papilio xuthus TaxID=66420 RepID=A0AAJ6Z4M5_PAPXU|nr:PREDICTED: uncharacterized protein LOC106116061 [Papilio xuthus]
MQDISQLRRVFGKPRNVGSYWPEIHIIRVPKECVNKTYCTIMPKYYPQERFNKLFENKTVISQPSLLYVDPNLANRVGEEDYDACESTSEINPLSMVKDQNNIWRLVVQAPEHNFRQIVHMKVCKNPYKKCQNYGFLPHYIVSYCKQSYVTANLLVTKGESDFEEIKVKLPACCHCTCKKI